MQRGRASIVDARRVGEKNDTARESDARLPERCTAERNGRPNERPKPTNEDATAKTTTTTRGDDDDHDKSIPWEEPLITHRCRPPKWPEAL